MATTTTSFLSALISLNILFLIIGSATCEFDITKIKAHKPSEGGVLDLNSKHTINANLVGADSLEGVYSGVYGSHGTEIVQLKIKYGKWDDSDPDFYAYVEATKLTGDVNVPAGQVTFRAKLGSIPSQTCQGSQALATYVGQGRMAATGFVNPYWVDGVLFQLNKKLQGADLGFLWITSGQSTTLTLFTRLG